MDSSPKVAKVEIVQEGKVRRAKLYYLRELEGSAAKIEREVETQAAAAALRPLPRSRKLRQEVSEKKMKCRTRRNPKSGPRVWNGRRGWVIPAFPF